MPLLDCQGPRRRGKVNSIAVLPGELAVERAEHPPQVLAHVPRHSSREEPEDILACRYAAVCKLV
eukprot:6995136-Prymnesium_polylepis.2